MTCMWRFGEKLVGINFPIYMWVSGMELRPAGWTFIHCDVLADLILHLDKQAVTYERVSGPGDCIDCPCIHCLSVYEYVQFT